MLEDDDIFIDEEYVRLVEENSRKQLEEIVQYSNLLSEQSEEITKIFSSTHSIKKSQSILDGLEIDDSGVSSEEHGVDGHGGKNILQSDFLRRDFSVLNVSSEELQDDDDDDDDIEIPPEFSFPKLELEHLKNMEPNQSIENSLDSTREKLQEKMNDIKSTSERISKMLQNVEKYKEEEEVVCKKWEEEKELWEQRRKAEELERQRIEFERKKEEEMMRKKKEEEEIQRKREELRKMIEEEKRKNEERKRLELESLKRQKEEEDRRRVEAEKKIQEEIRKKEEAERKRKEREEMEKRRRKEEERKRKMDEEKRKWRKDEDVRLKKQLCQKYSICVKVKPSKNILLELLRCWQKKQNKSLSKPQATNLQIDLDFGYKKLKDLKDDDFQQNILLQSLVLYKNNISKAPALTNVLLRSLYLNSNNISHLNGLSMYLPLLEILNLSDNRISDIDSLASFTMLKVLDLSFNKLTSLHQLKALGSCRKLEKLKINDNPVARDRFYQQCIVIMLPQLKELDNIEIHELEFHNTNRSYLGIYYFSQNFPSICNFFRNLADITRNNLSLKQFQSVLSKQDACSSNILANILRFLYTYNRRQVFKEYMEWESSSYQYMCHRQTVERNHIRTRENRIFAASEKRSDGKSLGHHPTQSSKHPKEERSKLQLKHYEEQCNFQSAIYQNVFSHNREYLEQKSINVIKEWVKRIIARRKEKKLLALVKFQAYWRGYVTRKKWTPVILKHIHKRHVAATRIQARYRGYVVRKILKDVKLFDDEQIELPVIDTSDLNYQEENEYTLPNIFQHRNLSHVYESQDMASKIAQDCEIQSISSSSVSSTSSSSHNSSTNVSTAESSKSFQLPPIHRDDSSRGTADHSFISSSTTSAPSPNSTRSVSKTPSTNHTAVIKKKENHEQKIKKIMREWGLKDEKAAEAFLRRDLKRQKEKRKNERSKKKKGLMHIT